VSTRIRARNIGIPFKGTPGDFNSITDVPGVEVGYRTLIEDSEQSSTGQKPIHNHSSQRKEYHRKF